LIHFLTQNLISLITVILNTRSIGKYAESIVEVLREGWDAEHFWASSYRIESCTRLNPNSTKYEVG